jgi:hypothetical protein
LAKNLARLAGAEDIALGHKLLADHRENAPNLVLAAREALKEVTSIRGKPGRPSHTWYDDFLRFLIAIAEKNGVKPTLGYDDAQGRAVGTIWRFACAFEKVLHADMRSTSSIAMKRRLDRSKQNIGWKGGA